MKDGRSLAGQRALVTGGANGIGAAIVERLAAEGAETLIVDLDAEGAKVLADRVGGRAMQLDVSDAVAVRDALHDLGRCDILVNNAGADQHAFFTDTEVGDWQRLLGINLLSVLATTHALLPAMQRGGGGRIVNVASEAGRLGSRGGAVYAAAKGGVIAFTRSIARENARYGITANVVVPGPIDTPMLQRAVEAGGQKMRDAMAGATLLRRLGTPAEVAAAVAFLASPEAAFITGEALGVSGGMGCGA